ncbi:MAG: hypothetical protein HZA14_06255 [Nitrospirae bacterium]|nr:hypothetical protein [Nitrospirota bacterium]
MINAFIKEIEEALSKSSIVVSSTIQKYFGSSKKDAYIRGDLLFIDMSSFEFAVYITERGKKVIINKYRLQFMDSQNRLIFRYDNAPHHKDILTFPNHKHLHDGKVINSNPPKFSEILEEITASIAQSSQ